MEHSITIVRVARRGYLLGSCAVMWVGCYAPTHVGESSAGHGGESSDTSDDAAPPLDGSSGGASTSIASMPSDDDDESSTADPSWGRTDDLPSDGPDPCLNLVCGGACGECAAGSCVAGFACCTEPTVLGAFDTAGTAVGIDVVGTQAYVADFDGLRFLDVADPSAIVDRGLLSLPSYAWDVRAVADRAYVAWAYAGLVVVDVSDPAMPVQLAGAADALGTGVAIDGELAYVVGGSGYDFHVVDLAARGGPTVVGTLPLSGQILRVTVDGSHAYLPVEGDGLRVVDLSDPTLPVDVGVFVTEGYARDVALAGHVAWLSVAYEGVIAVDISTPYAPAELGRVAISDTEGTLGGIALHEGVAVVAHGDTGVELLWVENPDYPQYIDTAEILDARDVVVADGIAYVAAGVDGISVLALPECGA